MGGSFGKIKKNKKENIKTDDGIELNSRLSELNSRLSELNSRLSELESLISFNTVNNESHEDFNKRYIELCKIVLKNIKTLEFNIYPIIRNKTDYSIYIEHLTGKLFPLTSSILSFHNINTILIYDFKNKNLFYKHFQFMEFIIENIIYEHKGKDYFRLKYEKEKYIIVKKIDKIINDIIENNKSEDVFNELKNNTY
jgi:hypothetical protein